uniref:Uncharacterized protein n=1 Tax=Pseudictyota dubia TaxID=2749911 RepID=A0A7R9VNJ7_9STRA|mmetsp:Transcript_18119/g.33759  ORF Transcript_18119/g.33759 Transcript_18119/m.33759 type:complete len:175 (+) Transcript_18119:364-888(+)
MPTLFPPLEAGGDGESILPADVRENFDAIQAIIRVQSRLANEQELSGTVSSVEEQSSETTKHEGDNDASTEDTMSARELKAEGLESRKRSLAVATAIAVHSEVSRLTNGIAELESLLLEQGDGVNPSEIEFPALPTVIDEEETKDSQEKESGGGKVEDPDSATEEMDVLDQVKK